MNINLNPELKLDELSSEFRIHRKLRIENFFSEDSANYIHQSLIDKTPWHLVISNEKGLPTKYSPSDLEGLESKELERLYAQAYQRASTSYQYSYKFFPIIDALKSGEIGEDSMLFKIAAFLNGTDFLRFARQLTGNSQIVKTDPQATLYETGHFLTTHDDSNYQRAANDTSTREFAIVLGFTDQWSNDWGGQTSFFQSMDSNESTSWHPGYNVLSIFQVPTLHCVNYVTPFATKGRYSITGWLRSDPYVARPDLLGT